MLVLCIDVYFVPTFILKGRIDSNGIEVYRPIAISPVGNGLVKAFTHLRDSAGNKITFVQSFFLLFLLFIIDIFTLYAMIVLEYLEYISLKGYEYDYNYGTWNIRG